MTLAEMKAAGRKAAEIESALEQLSRARWALKQVNLHVKDGQVWKPLFLVKARSSHYSNDEVTLSIPVPGGYLQQWAVDQVRAAEREVVLAGGIVPPMPKEPR